MKRHISRIISRTGISKRYNSISSLYEKIRKSPSELPLRDQIIPTLMKIESNPAASELESSHKLIELIGSKSDDSEKIVNKLLETLLKHDFSLYYTVTKLKKFRWNQDSLLALLKANPGRVYSSWELAHDLKVEWNSDITNHLFYKVLHGEKQEMNESEHEFTNSDIAKALFLIEKGSHEIKPELIDAFIAKLIKSSAISAVRLSQKAVKIISKRIQEPLPEEVCNIRIFASLFEDDLVLLSKELICRYLDLCNKIDIQALEMEELKENKNFLQTSKYYKELVPEAKISYRKIDREFILSSRDRVLQTIEENKLDIDKSPEALLLRLKMIETYGMYLCDAENTLRLFSIYSTKDKFGIDMVQNKLSLALFLIAYKNSDHTLYSVAETMINPEKIPIFLLQAKILSSNSISKDLPLEIYNDFISDVSRSINQSTGRSSSGLLTEALILSYLSNSDREFANLVYEKAIGNNVISDELEISVTKRLFKVYGDAWVNDSVEEAAQIMHDYVVSFLRSIKSI